MSMDTPHSWRVIEWPPHVFPNSKQAAKYLVDCNRDSLTKFGALKRVGRDLVIVGAKFEKWLENSEHTRAVQKYNTNQKETQS
jgi:hypothetical protein